MQSLSLRANEIKQMEQMIHHRFSTIYSEAHSLAFGTDQLFNNLRSNIAAQYGEDFLQSGKPSINQQCKVALSRLSNGNDEYRRQLFSEYAANILRSPEDDYDFTDLKMKPSELWALCDDSRYGSIKLLLSAIHRNPAGASGGERNHKVAKHVQSRLRVRLSSTKVEIATAILFNSKQVGSLCSPTRDSRFCNWLKCLGSGDEVHLERQEEEGGGDTFVEEADNDNNEDLDDDKLDRIDVTDGIEKIGDDTLFDSG